MKIRHFNHWTFLICTFLFFLFQLDITYPENDFLGYDPPSASLYTGMSTQSYFVCFIVMNILHILFLIIMKSCLSKDFQQLNFLDKVLHCAESMSFAFPVRDWDYHKHGGPKEHYARMKSNHRETLWNININLFVNCCYLLPLVYFCKLFIQVELK